jgi:MerR family transcriptional regulator, heat shock protein HspR
MIPARGCSEAVPELLEGYQRVAAMNRPIIPRNLVARELSISERMLLRYESLGLVRVVHAGSEEGYEPAQVRRLWTIVSFQRDLGVNLAGVELILSLCDQLADVHHRLGGLAEDLRAALEPSESPTGTDLDE